MVPIAYNVRSLAVRRTTTIATASGIALVVFVLASSLMLGQGIQRTLGGSGRPEHGFVLRKGANSELSSYMERRLVNLILAAPGVALDHAGAPLAVGEVIMVIAADRVGSEGQVGNVMVRGTTDAAFALRPEVSILAGRRAKPGSNEVIIGQRLRGRFEGIDLDQSFELKTNRKVNVVGVFESGGSAFESEVWADVETVRTSFGREGYVSSVTVKLEEPSKFDGFAAVVENDKQLGLDAERESAYYEKHSESALRFVLGMGVVIASLFSIGAMIGAMITMHAAVAQRRREVGTLRALGFSRAAILFSFLLEAFLLAVVGGLLGAGLASTMGFVKFSLTNFNTWSEIIFSFDPNPQILIFSVLVGGIMGVIGGFLPAVRAARTSPIAAMRG
jgi:putative ABC transport system permease protein